VRRETSKPLALGFGFSKPEHLRAIADCADAAVVGSALVSVIAEHGQSPALLGEVERYVQWLRS
jgi:tryptophan synthase alpha chain